MLGSRWEDIFICVFENGPATFVDARTAPPCIEEGDQRIRGDHLMERLLHIEEALQFEGTRSQDVKQLVNQIMDECLGPE